jgi:ribokinase
MALEQHAASVVVAGSINVDLIVGVPRLPAAGETVLGDGFVQQNGGKSANQAVAAARVGAAVTILGAVGDDDMGRSALRGLADAGVDTSRCRTLPDATTGLALIVVDAAGENQIAVASGANARLDGNMIEVATVDLQPAPGSVCLIGFEVSDRAVLAAARWAAAAGMRLIVNPAPARPLPDGLAELGPILTPNEAEAEMLSGQQGAEAAAAALSAWTKAPVIVTLGAAGALLWTAGAGEHLAAHPVTAVDTTGAGDALNGILAAELARGSDLRAALRWAMTGAALKTTAAGAQAGLPSRDEIAARVQAA